MFVFEYRVASLLALAGLAFGGCSAAASGADVGAGDARPATDTGSTTNDVGAVDPDVGVAGHDAGSDVGVAHDGGGASDAGSCALLDTCCPRITGNPEFHDGCVIAVASGNAASCSASLAQDCCAALQNCCGAIADTNQRMLCQEVVSSHDGMICQSDLDSACGP